MTSRVVCSAWAAMILIVLSTTAGLAYEPRGERLRELIENTSPEERADIQTHRMKKRLRLDEEQVRKVREINLKHARKVQHVFDSHEGRFREFRELREFGEHKDRELQSVLSAGQYEDYLDMKDDMREHMMEFRQR